MVNISDFGRVAQNFANNISGAITNAFSNSAIDRLMSSPSTLDRFGAANTSSYTVQRGDTLSGIARQYGTDWQTLARINGLSNPDLIVPDQQIRLPAGSATTHTVVRGDTLSAIAAANGTSISNIARANGISNPNRIYPGQVLTIATGQSNAPSAANIPDSPATAPTSPSSALQNGQVNLDRLLDPSLGSRSPLAVIIGNAEGTRTPNGGMTRAYGSHIDPGNNVTNRGSFSLQNAGGMTPEQADRTQIGRLAAQRTTYETAVRNAGLDPNNAALATAYFDLYNQSPRAAGRFLNQVGYLNSAGISTTSLTELRFRSFVNVNTGQRFQGAGGGFANIAERNLGRTPTEAQVHDVIRNDQSRRQNAMARAITALNVAEPASRPQARPADIAVTASGTGPISSRLPASGTGFTTYNREQNAADQVGRAGFVTELQSIAAIWSRSGNARVSFGDISREGGGAFAPHSQHRNGNEVDIRPFRQDGRNLPSNINDPSYDRSTTRAFIELVRSRHPDATIYFNDPVLIREGLVQYSDGHHNHLHIGF